MHPEQPTSVQLTNTDVETYVITTILVAIEWRNDQLEPGIKMPQIIPLALKVLHHPDMF
jgi:hypothetical protein